MSITIKYTHAQYMNGECSHEEFYDQFVTKELIYLVSTALGNAILASKDEAMNDVALCRWDRLTGIMLESLPYIAKANGGGVSLSDKVCTLKAAARRYKGSPDLIKAFPPLGKVELI